MTELSTLFTKEALGGSLPAWETREEGGGGSWCGCFAAQHFIASVCVHDGGHDKNNTPPVTVLKHNPGHPAP